MPSIFPQHADFRCKIKRDRYLTKSLWPVNDAVFGAWWHHAQGKDILTTFICPKGSKNYKWVTGIVFTVSWELWKHPDPAPGGRPKFFKAKLPKESKNGFKTISCCRYPVMFFSKNYFRHQKSSTFCWFLNFYVNIHG